MIFFWILILLVIVQRLVELTIAKRNEKILRDKGAFEVGEEHYKWIILLHILFFACLIIEVLVRRPELSIWAVLPFTLFIAAQVLRLWSISSLGHFWNTKIIILPGAKVISRGPYKFLKHPNYLVVAAEIFSLPLIFHAYYTMVLFSILNALVISKIRIPDEEKALKAETNYESSMRHLKRFVPTPPRK